MIGKVIIGKSFGGCLRYCLEDKKMATDENQELFKNRAEVLLYNQCFGNKAELTQQFNDVRWLNRKQSNPVLHITLSLAPGEQLTQKHLAEIAHHCAQDFGFNRNQFIVVEHKDTKHQHIHIVANRIGFEGKTNVSDSNSYKTMANFCRKMEHQYKLTEVLSPIKFLPKELKNTPRHDKRKDGLKIAITQSLQSAKSFDEFSDKIQAKGYEIVKGRGISFVDKQAVKTKGSDIGFSLDHISKQVEKNIHQQPMKAEHIKKPKRKLRL